MRRGTRRACLRPARVIPADGSAANIPTVPRFDRRRRPDDPPPRRLRRLRGVATAALLAPGALAQPPTDGAIAPAHAWYCEGGSASHGRRSAAAPVRKTPHRVWQVEFASELEGEPLAWGDRIVAVERRGADRAAVHVLRALDGKPAGAPLTVEARNPLAPTLWQQTLLLRTAPHELSSYALGRGGPALLQRRRLPGVGPPVRFGSEVYVTAGGSLYRLDADTLQVAWATGDRGLTGAPALLGDAVAVLDHRARLHWLQRTDGAPRMRWNAPPNGTEPLGTDARVAAGPAHALAFPGGPPAWAAYWERAADRPAIGVFSILDVALWQDRWLGRLDRASGAVLYEHVPAPADTDTSSGIFGHELQTPRLERPLRTGARLAIAGDVAYLGGTAIDLAADHAPVLWSVDFPENATVIPLDGGLLVAGGRTLQWWRPPAPAAATAARPWQGRGFALLRGGSRVAGLLTLSPDTAALTEARSARRIALAEVLYVEDSEGTPRHFGRPVSTALAALRDASLRSAYPAYLRAALESGDVQLWRRLLATVRRLDLPARHERALRARLAGTAPTDDAPTDNAAAHQLRQREQTLQRDALRLVSRRVEQAVAGRATDPGTLELIRAMLTLAPHDPAARAAVWRRLPDGLRATAVGNPLAWLDLVEARAQTEIELVRAAGPRQRGDRDQRALARWREEWRTDLVALRSASLTVFTAADTPKSIARCLSLGELLCRQLETWFAGEQPADRRLHVLLYGSKEEYLRESRRAGARGHLSWTAGHYSPAERLSRVFLPPDATEFEKVMDVLAHELTHQWLAERASASTVRRPARATRHGGHWIVEGLAGMVQELDFDLSTRTCTPAPNASRQLDTVAHAAAVGALLPWDRLFSISHRGLGDLQIEAPDGPGVSLTTYARGRALLSEVDRFYAQSAAACHYLFHADDGRHRPALLAFALAQDAGRPPELEAAFGLTAAELGARTEAFARALFVE